MMDISNLCYKDVAKKIIERMIKDNRGKKEVKLLPFTPDPAFDQSWPCYDFSKHLGDFKEGDTAYIATDLILPNEGEFIVSVSGNSQISFNGELIVGEARSWNMPDGKGDVICHKVTVKKGMNRLVVKNTATENFFGFYMYVARESAPLGWRARPTIPQPDFYEQEGFVWSRIYKGEEKAPEPFMECVDWIFPQLSEEKICFDFNKMTETDIANGVTWASGAVELLHKSPISVYVDGKKVYQAQNGCFKDVLTKDTLLIVEATRNENGFGFIVENGTFRVPFYDTKDNLLTWLWIEGVSDLYQNFQLKEPYERTDGAKTFFKFYRQNTFLRPYMDTEFFAEWFYPIMVSHYGLLKTAEHFGLGKYEEYFEESISTICDYYEYIQYDNKMFGAAPFLRNSIKLDHLDPIGAIGMNAAELFFKNGSKTAYNLCYSLCKALDNVPKTKDGIFYRKDTFWADDIYMCVPFLARLGKLSGDNKYFTEAVKQIKGFYKLLHIEEKKLFSHIYLVKENIPTRIPWGRGNGWIFLALSELLLLMPSECEGYEEVLHIYREHAKGILDCQDVDGMWHQVLDELDSYAETSATGMFIVGLTRGILNEWIDKSISEKVKKAWKSLIENYIDEDGNVTNVCMGTRFSMSREYYRNLVALKNDNHGLGIVLLATTMISELEER